MRHDGRGREAGDLLSAPLFRYVHIGSVDPSRKGEGRIFSSGQDPVALQDVVLSRPLQFRYELEQNCHPVSPELALHLWL